MKRAITCASPTNDVRAYWFGRRIGERSAVTAVEFTSRVTREQRAAGMSRKETRAYVAFYERPEAGGRSSAIPGQAPPDGEIQVVSQPRELEAAQGVLDAFNGINGELRYPPWPRFAVTLRNGERAIVVPDRAEPRVQVASGEKFGSFSVITADTLVSVIAPVAESEIAAVARQLIPVTRENAG